jgi:hypothetical protein
VHRCQHSQLPLPLLLPGLVPRQCQGDPALLHHQLLLLALLLLRLLLALLLLLLLLQQQQVACLPAA